MADKKRAASNRWSTERRAQFLEALASTSNVAAAERAAEMAPGSAYKERARDADFAAAWAQALREGYDLLETRLLERAIKGQRKAVREKGVIVGYETAFSERLALQLLSAHRQTVRGVAVATVRNSADIRLRIEAKIAAALKLRSRD